MNIKFQKKDKFSKQRFIFEDFEDFEDLEDHDDFIKTEPVINEELEITPVIDLDAVKTEQDEPNEIEKSDLNFPIETQLNFPIENQANVLKTYALNKAKITKHYTTSTSKNSNNLTVPELIENSLPNETQPVEIKIETIEEIDVKENIIFDPFEELDIEENIVKTDENVAIQPLGIEDVTDNLINGKSALKGTVHNVVNSSTPIVIEDTNKISCMYCEVKVKDLIQLDIHTQNLHYQSPSLLKIRPIEPYFKCDHCGYQTKRKQNLMKHIFAKHMPKTAQKPVRKRLKCKCHFCNKQFKTKCEMNKHIKTHNFERPSCKCVHRVFGIHVKPPRGAPFACHLCKLVTCTRGDLKRHIVKFHEMKCIVYKCHHCQSRFFYKDHLIAHLTLQWDANTSQYKCSNPNYKTQSQWYECETCSFKCMQKVDLEAHTIKHNIAWAKKVSVPREKRYTCQICKFKSSNQKDFNKHLKNIHQQSKPYYCKICDCKYSWLRELVRHIKYTHLMIKE